MRLRQIDKWCSVNGLNLNVAKSFKLSITKRRNEIDNTYTLSNNAIVNVTSMRDLGVIVDSKLSFEQHIRSISSISN